MAKVLLISCNVTREPYPVYPLGMTMVAEAARARRHQVREWDLLKPGPSPDGAVDAIRSFEPDVIGLSLRNIDNIDSCALIDYTGPYAELVRTLRDHSSSPIVLGGAGYSLFPETLLAGLGADYGVVGEGELAFCDLIDDLTAGRAPEERIVRGLKALAGDEFSALARDPELAPFYLKEGGMLNVQTKRGCPHACAYCTYPILEGCTYRFRPPEAVVDEIEMLVTRYGADYYAIADSVFNDRQGRYLAIAEELVRRGITTPWMAFFRPDRFRREEVELLERAGLQSVEWGTDCSSNTTLRAMRKDFTWDEVDHSNRLFGEAGIAGAHFIIFGGPGETEATMGEGLANIENLTNCVVFAFCGVRVLPGTAIHKRAVEEGTVASDEDLLEARFYLSGDVTRAFLHDALLASFGDRTDRLYPPGEGAERIEAFHRLGYRGPVWDLLLGKGGRRRRK